MIDIMRYVFWDIVFELFSDMVFAKVDLKLIHNDREKKKGAKKYKPRQIFRKLLVTLLLSTSFNA